MRTLPILTGAALVLVAAGATMAASPSPSASPSPQPSATPAPSTAPSTTASNAQSWSASIQPLHQTTGTAKVVEAANGTGTMTITLDGLRADTRWTVDVDGGTLPDVRENAANEIAFRAGAGLDHTSNRTVTFQLTKHEMQDFATAVADRGVVVMVSDGINQSYAAIPKA
jgi:hypothetical protein